ncbi:DUF192 domain-containing protein [Noviherbaspirillum cavernae]|uniref:DUF192 domain-containing protein n=1 Tax=Noviherbaspirillum cavernae TaxID=2320862 RepID=A0A418WZ14_9BURK|nr:DUF192 domain-containing protein [Noviherbaspirillum cavernae]RJG05325.1 DUF192 domain-containing protein [Noviherbaspirillum cavernae]
MKLGAIYLRDECLVPRVWNATGFWDRMRGLLGRPQLQPGEGMLIDECRLVHTFGMHYDLDLAFLDRRGQVRKLVSHLSPSRMMGSFPAHTTLELAPGTLTGMKLKKGDVLTWRETQA